MTPLSTRHADPTPASRRFHFPPRYTTPRPMPATARKILVMIGNALLGLVASIFIIYGTGAWDRKENASDHKLDLVTSAAKEAADVARLNTKLQRVIDILCEPRRTGERPYACSDPDAGSTAGGDVKLPPER